MNEVRWERMLPHELESAFGRKPVVYFTYGLCEPHGLHCAVGLDGLKAYEVAVATARRHGGIVAPPDFWHVHEIGGYAVWARNKVGEVDRKWLTAMPPWQHFKNVCYHVRAADVIGFEAAIFITGHYGPNWKDLKTVLELIQPLTRTRLYGLPDWEANVPGFDGDGRSGGDHAGKVETSLMWALDPACVDVSRFPASGRSGVSPGDAPPTERQGPDRFPMAMGPDAPLADKEVGRRMVDDEVRWLHAKTEELLREFSQEADCPGLPTFADVERFWSKEIAPRMGEFESMQPDFGLGSDMPEDSVWYANMAPPEVDTW